MTLPNPMTYNDNFVIFQQLTLRPSSIDGFVVPPLALTHPPEYRVTGVNHTTIWEKHTPKAGNTITLVPQNAASCSTKPQRAKHGLWMSRIA
jgi:hypothetical protein